MRHLRCSAFQTYWRKTGGYFVLNYFFARLADAVFDDFGCRILKKFIITCSRRFQKVETDIPDI